MFANIKFDVVAYAAWGGKLMLEEYLKDCNLPLDLWKTYISKEKDNDMYQHQKCHFNSVFALGIEVSQSLTCSYVLEQKFPKTLSLYNIAYWRKTFIFLVFFLLQHKLLAIVYHTSKAT